MFVLRTIRGSKHPSGFPGTQLKSFCLRSFCFAPGSHISGVLSFNIVYLAVSFKYFGVLLGFLKNGVCVCVSLIFKEIRPGLFCM